MTDILTHLQRIAEARRPEDLWALLLARMAGYGFDRVDYGFTRFLSGGSIGDRRDVVFLSNHRRPGLAAGIGAGSGIEFLIRTPMFRWVSRNTGACSWRWAVEQRAAGMLSADEIAAMDQARQMGQLAGYSLGFAELSPRAGGAMGLTARPGLDQDAVDAIWERQGAEILAICNMTHLRITHMPFPVDRPPLSPRQREALEWVAGGKTMQDIAQIMGISPAMVEKHLRLARTALDVETTAHAVAKATMLNHIFAGAA